jgi:hypothetical protein
MFPSAASVTKKSSAQTSGSVLSPEDHNYHLIGLFPTLTPIHCAPVIYRPSTKIFFFAFSASLGLAAAGTELMCSQSSNLFFFASPLLSCLLLQSRLGSSHRIGLPCYGSRSLPQQHHHAPASRIMLVPFPLPR